MNSKIFVGGDLSGIQKFLYNISSKKAALSLRGRSAYLNKYMTEVFKEIKAKIPIIRDVYHDGGKFYLIIEDTEQNKQILQTIKAEREKQLWREHFGQLAINIAYVPYQDGKEGGSKDKIAKCFSDITQEFNKAKKQKFKTLLLDNYENFFSVQQVSADGGVCAVTGIESDGLEAIDGEIKVLPSVKQQIELGIKEKGVKKESFSDYAEDSYLGVLRMDVDGLGTRFAKGFDNWDDYSAFSDKLTEFFGKKVKSLAERKKDIELIYAGGDDVFAVGHWNEIINFAEEIHLCLEQEFKGQDIHISGGAAIVRDKFPISKAAELSGEAEEQAKKYINPETKQEKNAFTFFKETVCWDKDFQQVKQDKDKFITLCEKDNLPVSMLHKIMEYSGIMKENCKDSNKQSFEYLWHSAYYLTRFMNREGISADVKEFCREIRDKKMTDPEKLRLLAVSARWAELQMRDWRKQEENNK